MANVAAPYVSPRERCHTKYEPDERLESPSQRRFQVGNSDTLEKIALQYNATPSELLHLNKLNTRMVFPGQVGDFASSASKRKWDYF